MRRNLETREVPDQFPDDPRDAYTVRRICADCGELYLADLYSSGVGRCSACYGPYMAWARDKSRSYPYVPPRRQKGA